MPIPIVAKCVVAPIPAMICTIGGRNGLSLANSPTNANIATPAETKFRQYGSKFQLSEADNTRIENPITARFIQKTILARRGCNAQPAQYGFRSDLSDGRSEPPSGDGDRD
jgi:hypothetical protein